MSSDWRRYAHVLSPTERFLLMRREAQAALRNSGTTRREGVEADPDKEWYTVKEAAQLLGEHPKTVYKRVREGEIKASRPSPRKTKIHKRDLADYLNRTTQ